MSSPTRLPPVTSGGSAAGGARALPGGCDWKRLGLLLLGPAAFLAILLWPPFPGAADDRGLVRPLSPQGQASLALFVFAAIWWVFEVVPIGVTSIALGILQALFAIRPAGAAFRDFLAPSVWLVFGSIALGMAFTKTGLTRRLAYRSLMIVGERSSTVLLGCYVLVAALTLVMAHTAVAATVYPILMTIHMLYADDARPTRFGKALFIGMAFVAGAASTVTLLGGARNAVALGFFERVVGREVPFFAPTVYMLPLGATMVVLIWLLMLSVFRPERGAIAGLAERAAALHRKLGAPSPAEKTTAAIVAATVLALAVGSTSADKTALLLLGALMLFVCNILSIKDLEEMPWNLILLFGGATSLGLCLWETGASHWLAATALPYCKGLHWLQFVIGLGVVALVATNLVLNVAVIALLLPVALAMAGHLDVPPEAVFCCVLACAGMPFLAVSGAAPNAIAFESRQFSAREFFKVGLLASAVLLAVLGLFVWSAWSRISLPPVA